MEWWKTPFFRWEKNKQTTKKEKQSRPIKKIEANNQNLRRMVDKLFDYKPLFGLHVMCIFALEVGPAYIVHI